MQAWSIMQHVVKDHTQVLNYNTLSVNSMDQDVIIEIRENLGEKREIRERLGILGMIGGNWEKSGGIGK